MVHNITANDDSDGLTNTTLNGIGGLNAPYLSNLLDRTSSAGTSGIATILNNINGCNMNNGNDTSDNNKNNGSEGRIKGENKVAGATTNKILTILVAKIKATKLIIVG